MLLLGIAWLLQVVLQHALLPRLLLLLMLMHLLLHALAYVLPGMGHFKAAGYTRLPPTLSE